LNRRHEDFQSSALPTELPRQDIGRNDIRATSYSNEVGGNVKQLFLMLSLSPDPVTVDQGTSKRQGIGLCLKQPHPIDSRKNLVLFGKTELFQFGENEGAI
jgi:hypothetical protein